MLAAQFQAVDLHIFDIHTTVKPLTSVNCLQQKFRFLADGDSYREQYASGKSILTPSFDIHPLSKHAQTRNHFWKNYLSRVYESSVDHWQRQAPFLGSLRQPIVSLTKALPFQGRVTPVVYLSALGWSANLNIHLRGDIQLSSLLDFILGITGSNPTSGLSMEGKPAKVSLIFSNLANKLLKEVYDPANPPTSGAPEMARYMIISLSKFGGPPLHYQRTSSTKGMNNAEQAMLHSLLRGERIGTRELAQKLRKPAPTILNFGPGPDFMLIYFDYGALVFMQESAIRKDRRQRALSCVASNIRSYAIMIWSMFNFYRLTQGATNQTVKDMRVLLKANLTSMKESYLSSSETMRGSVKYAHALFHNHAKLKELLNKPIS